MKQQFDCRKGENMENTKSYFNPALFKFAYNLDKYSCFRKLTGKCSLELSEEEVRHFSAKERISKKASYEYHKENSVYYCRLLAESFNKKGMTKPVEINPFSCGHYAFTDGQHRVCIAKTIGMVDIPAEIGGKWESECRVCYFIKRDPIYRLKHWIGKSEEFIR